MEVIYFKEVLIAYHLFYIKAIFLNINYPFTIITRPQPRMKYEVIDMKNWFEDLNKDSIEKSSEIPPRISLPDPSDDAVVVKILSEPETVEVKSRKDTMVVCEATRIKPEPIITKASLVMPNSLRFNMAKAITQAGKDYTKFKMVGSEWRITSVIDDGNKYYHAELVSA